MKLCTVCGEISNDDVIVCKFCENEDIRIIMSMNIDNLNNTFHGEFEKSLTCSHD